MSLTPGIRNEIRQRQVDMIEDSSDLALASAKLINTDMSAIWHSQMPKSKSFPSAEFMPDFLA